MIHSPSPRPAHPGWLPLGAALLAVSFGGCSSKQPEPQADAAPTEAVAELVEDAAPSRSIAPFTVLVMGDNRGEIRPCGCKDYPRGGLPRRATFLEQAREEGPVLLLDAGDALFEDPFRKSGFAKARAELVLEGMGRLGTAAMAVGDRDLTEGVEWLLEKAEAAEVPLLSSNLRTEDGAQPFEGHRLFEVGEAKVGVFGIFGQRAGMRMPRGVTMEDPVEAAKAEVEALRAADADLIIALVHGPTDVIRAVAAVPGVEVIVPSHDGSISLPYRPRPEAAWIVAGGQLGRTLTSIRFHLDGAGRLEDAGEADQLEKDRERVINNLELAKVRFERSPPGDPARAELAKQIQRLEQRDVDLVGRIKSIGEVKGRRFESHQHNLGDEIADDPEMEALVAAFEAAHSTASR